MDTSCVSSKYVRETPKHGPSLSEIGLGGLKKETPKCRPSPTQVDCSGKIEVNHTSGCMLSEVDWKAHDSSLFVYLEQIDHNGESSLLLYLEKIDHDGKPQDFFTSGIWGRLLQGKFSTSQLWGGPSKGNIFQPQEFLSFM